MAKTHLIKFRVTRDQYEELIVRARASKKISLAAYLRHIALEQPLLYDQLCENNKLVKILLSRIKP